MAGLKRITKIIKFRNKVGRAITYLELEEPLWFQDSPNFSEDEEFIDDGMLHIRRSGTRVVFNVSNDQNADAKEQNRQVRRIMEQLNMKRKIPALLINENEDEENQ